MTFEKWFYNFRFWLASKLVPEVFTKFLVTNDELVTYKLDYARQEQHNQDLCGVINKLTQDNELLRDIGSTQFTAFQHTKAALETTEQTLALIKQQNEVHERMFEIIYHGRPGVSIGNKNYDQARAEIELIARTEITEQS